MGGDPRRVNPLQPVDLVVDHSVQVDSFGSAESFQRNVAIEFTRNEERYKFLRWGQQAFDNFRVVPPGTGIVHQVNLEYLATVVQLREQFGELTAYPDTLVGTDSHTTMINGLGVVGWGVGGIEAEAVMLGQPYFMLIPEVVGMKLTGALPLGTTATDLVLTATEMLRHWENLEQRPRTPVVALTAHILSEHKERARLAGMDGHMAKPVELSQLRELIEYWVAEKEMRDRHAMHS